MTTSGDVCNRAMAKIGTRTVIADITESSAEAIQCNLVYDTTRKQVLSMAFWNFARKTALLGLNKMAPGAPGNPTVSSTVTWSPIYPAPPWPYEYFYPSDCIQLRYVMGQANQPNAVPIYSIGNMISYEYSTSGPVQFIVASGTDSVSAGSNLIVIDTFATNAIGVYTRNVDDLSLWPDQSIEALVYAISGKVAIALTGSKELSNMMFTQANAIIIQARATDGNESMTMQNYEAEWIRARNSGGWTPQGPYFGTMYNDYNPLFVIS